MEWHLFLCSILLYEDIVLFLCERGHVEGGMVFQLLEDLTEVSTIKDCKEVFGYIESKQETLGKASVIFLIVTLIPDILR